MTTHDDAEKRFLALPHARILTLNDDEYPQNLRWDVAPPPALWVAGVTSLADLHVEGVSIVGSRASTAYGTAVATDLATDLATRGRIVVSGLAFGIDGAAHRGALAAGKPTVAVVAGGIDRPYPMAHTNLYRAILETGAVVSLVPPGAPPTRDRFLARNRVIAALCSDLVVVEAGLRSGSVNTVTHAESLNRTALHPIRVHAVPGPVTSAASAGTHDLIRSGRARLVTSAEDVLA